MNISKESFIEYLEMRETNIQEFEAMSIDLRIPLTEKQKGELAGQRAIIKDMIDQLTEI